MGVRGVGAKGCSDGGVGGGLGLSRRMDQTGSYPTTPTQSRTILYSEHNYQENEITEDKQHHI